MSVRKCNANLDWRTADNPSPITIPRKSIWPILMGAARLGLSNLRKSGNSGALDVG